METKIKDRKTTFGDGEEKTVPKKKGDDKRGVGRRITAGGGTTGTKDKKEKRNCLQWGVAKGRVMLKRRNETAKIERVPAPMHRGGCSPKKSGEGGEKESFGKRRWIFSVVQKNTTKSTKKIAGVIYPMLVGGARGGEEAPGKDMGFGAPLTVTPR